MSATDRQERKNIFEEDHRETSNVTIEENSYAGEALKSLQQENESRVEDQKARDNQGDALRKRVDESLQQTMTNVYMIFDQVVDQMKNLYPNIPLSRSKFNPFNIVREETLVDNCSASSEPEETWFDFLCQFLFYL